MLLSPALTRVRSAIPGTLLMSVTVSLSTCFGVIVDLHALERP